MDRILIDAWAQIEAKERLDEGKRVLSKVSAIKSSPKGKVTAVKGSLKEDGESGCGAAGDGNPSPTAGGSMTQSGNAARFKQRLGKKVNEDIKSDATNVAQNAIRNVKSGKGTSDDSTLVGSMVSEALPDTPLPPGAEDIDLDDDAGLDAGEDTPEVGGSPEEMGDEEVSVDAQTASQVVDSIMKQYPGAVVTISIQLPEDTPFDTDLVAAAQEVVDGGNGESNELAPDAGIDGATEVGADSEIPSDGEENPDELFENRKRIITKTRKQIKEMFARMEGEEDPAGIPEVPETDPSLDGVDPSASVDTEETLTPEVEVGDTKIALSPEQWGQVLATTDLLGGGDDLSGIDAGLPGGGEEEPAAIGGDDDEQLQELRTEVDLDTPQGKSSIKKIVQKNDYAKDKKIDVSIKKAGMNESFNSELAGYSDALQRMIRN